MLRQADEKKPKFCFNLKHNWGVKSGNKYQMQGRLSDRFTVKWAIDGEVLRIYK